MGVYLRVQNGLRCSTPSNAGTVKPEWCQKMVPTHSIRAYEAQCHANGFGKLLVVAEGFEPTGDVVFETTAYSVLLRDQIVIIR